ncbi:MAG: MBL fold metallo-hydrolase, partial [Steroidobacteraceae bacterium]
MKIVNPLAPTSRFIEHRCGIFSVDASYAPLWAKQNITYVPVRDSIWTVSNGIYRTIFVEGATSLIAFDTFESPGAARSFKRVMQRVFPLKPVRTLIYSHDHLDHCGYASEITEGGDILAHRLCDTVVRARRAPQQYFPNEV